MDVYTLKSYLKLIKEKIILVTLSFIFLVVVLLGLLLWWLSPNKFTKLFGGVGGPSPTPAAEALPIMTELPTADLYSASPESELPLEVPLPVTYVVQKGDSLWRVAQAFYGDGAQSSALATANTLSLTAGLEVGQKLYIPAQANLPKVETEAMPTGKGAIDSTQANTSAVVTYQVKPGDSLWKISQAQLGNPYLWTKLYQSNRKVIGRNPNLIFPGTTLVLPVVAAPDSQTPAL